MTTTTAATPALHASPEPTTPQPRPSPLTYFGMPLGLAGLAGAWLAAHLYLGAPTWPVEALYALSTAAWLTFTSMYVVRGSRRYASFKGDIQDPSTGPMTAFIPTVAILLSSHYAQYLPQVGRWVTVFFVAALFVVTGQLVSHWFAAGIGVDSLHGGFFIPVVAGPFIASVGLTTVGIHQGALMAWGAGAFFWLSFGTILMGRHMTGAKLPKPATPTLAAFLAAPASGGLAWTVSHPGPIGEVEYLLLGILFTMLLIQINLINEYRKLTFGLQFWIFTFPAAATSNFIIRWVAQTQNGGWHAYGWVALGLATTLISAIGIASLRLITQRPSASHRAPTLISSRLRALDIDRREETRNDPRYRQPPDRHIGDHVYGLASSSHSRI